MNEKLFLTTLMVSIILFFLTIGLIALHVMGGFGVSLDHVIFAALSFVVLDAYRQQENLEF